MDKIPDQETLHELVEEGDLTRRKILIGAGLAGPGGWLVIESTLDTTGSRLTDAEESAITLADGLNETDLRDPRMMSGLTPMIDSTIETINEVLHDSTVTRGMWLAEKERQLTNMLSNIPGVASSPAQTAPAKRMARLEAALTYYESLNDVFQHAAATQRVLATIETPAIDDRERPEQPLSSIIDIPPLKTSNEEARSVGEQATTEAAVEALLPDTEQVAGQLSTQIQLQTQFSKAIQAYLDTAEFIETGARQHEQGKLAQARSQFHAAKEALPTAVLESEQAYAISHGGPTLEDYATHFSKRGRGLDQLLAACESEIDASTQNARFNAGLSQLIDARGVMKQ